jgi:hypothetical protein
MIKGSLLSQVGVQSVSQCRKANDTRKSVVVVVVFVVTKTVEHAPQCSDAGTQVCCSWYAEYFTGDQKITCELPANSVARLMIKEFPLLLFFVVTRTVDDAPECRNAGTHVHVCRSWYAEYFRGDQKITCELPANSVARQMIKEFPLLLPEPWRMRPSVAMRTQVRVCRSWYAEYFRGDQKITSELPANCTAVIPPGCSNQEIWADGAWDAYRGLVRKPEYKESTSKT